MSFKTVNNIKIRYFDKAISAIVSHRNPTDISRLLFFENNAGSNAATKVVMQCVPGRAYAVRYILRVITNLHAYVYPMLPAVLFSSILKFSASINVWISADGINIQPVSFQFWASLKKYFNGFFNDQFVFLRNIIGQTQEELSVRGSPLVYTPESVTCYKYKQTDKNKAHSHLYYINEHLKDYALAR